MSKGIVSTSIIFIFLNAVNNIFKNSKTYGFLSVIGGFYKHSRINLFIERYLKRNSSLPESYVYKIFSGIFGFFDRLWDRLYSFLAGCSSSSTVISFIVKAFSGEKSFFSFSLLILFFSIGYAVTAFLTGRFGTVSAMLTILGVIASILLLPGKGKWKRCLESSFAWKFILYIFD